MADILRSQPVPPGFENAPVRNHPLAPQDGSVENAPNPSRVTNPDGKTEREDGRSLLLSNSNYESFIRELKSEQGLLDNLAGVLFTDLEAMAGTGKDGELLNRLSSFMEMITMDEGELLNFVKNQAARASEFGGPFFRLLKGAFDETGMVQIKTAILKAAGKYEDLASANHIIKTILAECKDMRSHMFQEDGKALEGIMEKLTLFKGPYPEDGAKLFDALKKSFDGNRQTLLKELIPFFAAYTKRTHDLGIPRERMLLVTDQAARFLNGDPDEMKAMFARLLTYSEVAGRLDGVLPDNLVTILGGLLRKRLEGGAGRLADRFGSLMETGLKSGSKEAFAGIMKSMLRGDSVYLPLFHMMVPVRIGGNTMLSELWADPDDRGGGNEEERDIRLLLRMEIKGLGSLDVVIGCRDRRVDLRIFYPAALRDREREIRTAIGAIAVQNGMTPDSLKAEVRRQPLELTDVFPKIKKRKDTVNVRV